MSSVTIKCEFCGQPKEIRVAEFNRATKKNKDKKWFCSTKCASAYRSASRTVKCVCPLCGTSFTKRAKEGKRYCSQLCANRDKFSTDDAKVTHSIKVREALGIPEPGTCNFCGKRLKRGQQKYCSVSCSSAHHWQLVFRDIEMSQLFPSTTHGETDRVVAKKYLSAKAGDRCSVCSKTGVKLVVDHIDGDALNSTVTNLRLLCEECDKATPTYKNRPHKATRTWRRKKADI